MFIIPEKWKPHAYQLKALKFILEHACSMLLLDPGLGKTAITLAAIKYLKDRGMLKKVLVIAPLRVVYNVWPDEIQKWTDFHGLTYTILHGPKKDANLQQNVDIYIINPEGLEWLIKPHKFTGSSGRVHIDVDMKLWNTYGFDTLVIDELSKFKHTNTVRFKTLKFVLKTFRRRWGLTGSPATNGLLDLFGQCYILDLGAALGPYITHYRMKYFTPDYMGFNWTIRPGAAEEIYEKVSKLALRMAADDYLDMPELIEDNIFVTLPDDTRKIYDEFEDELIAMIEGREVVARNAAAASMKCRQVVAGGVYYENSLQELENRFKQKRDWFNLHEVKLDALAELIDELQGSPLLVAYDFEHDIDRFKRRFGKDITYIGGGVTPKRARELIDLWNEGKLPVLFGHPQSIGHGLNLQESGHHVCWHTMTYDYNLYDQFNRRVLRQGNKSRSVFVHHILARDTIDEVILKVLKSKEHNQETLFSALKNLRK